MSTARTHTVSLDLVLAVIVLGVGFLGFAWWSYVSEIDFKACGIAGTDHRNTCAIIAE